jgi:hypothetical protein
MFSEFTPIAHMQCLHDKYTLRTFYFIFPMLASHMLWEADILSAQSFPSLLAVTWVYMRVLSPEFDISKCEMTGQAALCQIKLQGTYSSAIQHCIVVIEWLWAGEKLESYFGNKPLEPPPTHPVSQYL